MTRLTALVSWRHFSRARAVPGPTPFPRLRRQRRRLRPPSRRRSRHPTNPFRRPRRPAAGLRLGCAARRSARREAGRDLPAHGGRLQVRGAPAGRRRGDRARHERGDGWPTAVDSARRRRARRRDRVCGRPGPVERKLVVHDDRAAAPARNGPRLVVLGEVSRIHTEPVAARGPRRTRRFRRSRRTSRTVTDAEGKLTAGGTRPGPVVRPEQPATARFGAGGSSCRRRSPPSRRRSATAPSRRSPRRRSYRRCRRGEASSSASTRPTGRSASTATSTDGLPSAAGVNEFRQNLYGVSITPNLDSSGRFKAPGPVAVRRGRERPALSRPPSLVPPFGAAGAYVSGDSPAQPQPAFFGSTPKKGQLLSASLEYLVVPDVNFLVKAEGVRSYFTTDKNERSLSGTGPGRSPPRRAHLASRWRPDSGR